jgi:LEA14-like dessication related protein
MFLRSLLMICLSVFVLTGVSGLSACASLSGREPVKVNVVAVEPLTGQGLELRFMVKLRVQNPNDAPVEFDGIAIDLDVRGTEFASGVSDQRGTVPRFGELVLSVPVTVSASSVIKQALSFALGGRDGNRGKLSYEMRGKLASPGAGFGGLRFASSGEMDLPAGLSAAK